MGFGNEAAKLLVLVGRDDPLPVNDELKRFASTSTVVTTAATAACWPPVVGTVVEILMVVRLSGRAIDTVPFNAPSVGFTTARANLIPSVTDVYVLPMLRLKACSAPSMSTLTIVPTGIDVGKRWTVVSAVGWEVGCRVGCRVGWHEGCHDG